MATEENTNKPTPASDRITVGIEHDTTAVSFDSFGNTSTSSTGDSLNQGFDGEGEALSPEALAELEAGEELSTQETTEEGAEGDKPEDTNTEETPEDTEELPEWNSEDETVSSAYDGKYITKDEQGKDVLNFEAFNAEFSKERPQEDGTVKRDLNAGTRQYLKDRFGISDKLIDSHLAGVIAQERLIADTFHSQFGATPEEGKKTYETMFSWAKGSYSPAQRERYNAAMKAGGEAAQEQIELLKTRYLTKNPGKDETPKPGIGLRKERGVSPAKNATGGQTSKTPAVQAFANAEEHRVAQNEALKLSGKEKDAQLAEVRKRLQASTFWQK
ncbi:hypothetical protein ACQZ6C_10740 [Rhizobium rhizogenes]